MHVLYYHQHFSTPEGSTGTRSYEIASRLVAQGHTVTMVCGAGAVADTGLAKPFHHGVREGLVDGIRVKEFQLRYSNYDGFLKRTLTFLRFAFRSVGVSLSESYDIVFCTSTPLTAAVPGIFARWLRRKPFVFEVRDLWPELPRAMGVIRNPLVLRLMDWLEFAAYHSASHCIALSPGIADGIRRRGIPETQVTTIPNACDLNLFQPDTSVSLVPIPGVNPGDFVAAFTGAHGVANGLNAVLDAAIELRRRNRADIKLVFIGDGKEKPTLMARADSEELTNCVFMDPLDKRALAQLLCRRIDAGLMILANVSAFYFGTSPNKFFDYLASGLPIVVNYPGWMADIVEENGIGRVASPESATALADVLCNLADDPSGRRLMAAGSRNLAESQFSRDLLVSQLVEVLERVDRLARGGRPSSSLASNQDP